MASFLESLLVRLEADTRGLRQALAGGENEVAKYERNVDKFLAKSERRFQNYTSNVGRQLQGFAALVGVSFTVGSALDKLGETAGLVRLQQQTGLSVVKLQELQFAFRGVIDTQGELGQVMTVFARKVAEVKANTGEFAEFLRHANPALYDQIKASKSTAEALDIMANAIGRLRTEQDQNLLATKSFSEKGAELVPILRDGASGFVEAAAQARRFGAILSTEVVNSADETNKQFKALTQSLDTGFKRAIIGAADLVKRAWAEMHAESERALRLPEPEIGPFLAGVSKVAAELRKLKIPDFQTTVTSATGTETLKTKPDQGALDALREIHRQRIELEEETFLSIRLVQEKELAEFKRLLDERRITQEQFAQARVDIEAMASARVLAEVKKETERVAAQLQPFRSVIEQSLTDPLRDAFEGNMQSVGAYFTKMLQGFAMAIHQALILKPLLDAIQNGIAGPGGPTGLLNLLGLVGFGQTAAAGGGQAAATPFGGFFAEGGPMKPGVRYRVGERGAEDFVPEVPGFMLPNTKGASAGPSVTYNQTIDARGADIGAAGRIEGALMNAQRMQRHPAKEVGAYRRRFPTRRD